MLRLTAEEYAAKPSVFCDSPETPTPVTPPTDQSVAHYFHQLSPHKTPDKSCMVQEIGGRWGWIELPQIHQMVYHSWIVEFHDGSSIQVRQDSFWTLRDAWANFFQAKIMESGEK